ncbi:phosphoribosylamine--glycine ligase, partial [Salmonella enterica subsp. enterica]
AGNPKVIEFNCRFGDPETQPVMLRLQSSLVLLVEDLTETQMLEDKLVHSERLASIGRLAAGVAHEIGNPITGIACLAQNLREEREEDGEITEIS